VQDIVFTPIANDATRLAALISGEIDFVLDPAPRDIARLRSVGGVKVIEGPENRLIFIGMDQQRDELLYGSVKDKQPLQGCARAPGAVPGDRHRDDAQTS
jgi:peptide/nickel transport system substrate-binding protein